MAAAPRLPLRLLLLLLLAPPATPRTPGPSGRGRRFSELKVCADVECSMLMYRGEALEDFEGPDCRFVNFRKGDTVYVYYKLAGISPEVWAGSIGQAFGYFPKDLIHVAYEYTKEELQIPADETDFVCFNGGKDDFTKYSVEELLAHLELPSPAPGDLEEATAKASQHVEPPAEVSEDRGPHPATDSSLEASSTGTPGSAQVPEDGGEMPPSPPQADAPMEHGQRAPPSSKPLEATGVGELQALEGQSNRTSNSSQGPGEQPEKMDTYKRVKQEMTLDLQTRFGSTVDALVSDDETTRLVTSLEDELDDDLEAEYYMEGQEEEEEEEEDGVEDLLLLTFGHGDQGADKSSPGRTGVEGGAAGREPNSSGKAGEQVPPAPGGTADGGQRQRDGMDSGAAQQESRAGQRAEHSRAVDADDPSASGSRGVDPSVLELTGPTGAAGALGIHGVLQANKAKASNVDMDIHIPGKVASEKGPVPGETEAENVQPQERRASLPGIAQGTQRQSEPIARQGKDTVPSATASQDRDPWRAAVHVSKEESVGEPNPAGDPVGDRPLSGLKDERSEREAQASVPVPGENQQQDTVSRAEKDSVPGAPRPPHVLTREPLKQGSEEPHPPAHNSQPSSLSESGLKEGAPDQGGNGSRQLDSEEEQVGEGKEGLPEDAAEDFLEEEPVPNSTGQTVGAEALGSHPKDAEAEAEANDYTPEEQLEDENALSAQQARAASAPSTKTQDRLLGTGPQGPGGTAPGALRSVLETEGHREESGRKSEMEGPGEDAAGRAQGASGVAKEAGALVGHGAQTPSMRWGVLGMENRPQVPEAAAMPQVSSEPGEGEHPGENPKVSGELSDLGGLKAAQTPGPEPDGGDLAYWPPQHLPIISSFFKDQQSWWRFQKFVEVPKLEALLQDLSMRLRAAQRESLPYNAEKVLDKVFRSAESHILSVAEQMLDARASDSRDSEVFEEAAVLDDVQDLIYFVRYQHSTAELPAPPAMLPPPGDAMEGPTEELQPPTEEDFSQEKVEDLLMPEPGPIPGEPSPNPGEPSLIPGEPSLIPGELSPIPGEPSPNPGELSPIPGEPSPNPGEPSLIPGELSPIPGDPSPIPGESNPIPGEPSLNSGEPSPMDLPESSTTVATELFPEPGPEEDTGAGMLIPESSPVDAGEADKQLEKGIEEPTRATPLDSIARLIFSCVACLTRMLVATLPEDVQPGPDFCGLPWQPVLATAFWGIISLVFLWKTVLEVKAKKYQVTEQQISEKIENLRKENSKLVQELSSYEQKVKESKELAKENKKLSAIISEESVKYKDKIKKLEENNKALNDTARSLQDLLETERAQNAKNQDLILENKKSIKKLKDVISMNASELSEVQIALNEAKLSEEKVKSECHWVQEENAKLKKVKAQLQQEIKEWTKSHFELNEQIEAFKRTQNDLEETLIHKDDNIGVMTNCITQLNLLDCESQPENQNRGGNELDELANGEVAGDQPEKLKNRIKQMMDVSRTQTAVAVVEEDLNILQSKLQGSLSIKSNLEDQVKKLKEDRDSLLLVKSELEDECKILKQKVEILNELYQEKEMMLQKKLSQEEYGRQEREQLLSAADEKANLAAEEVKIYKQRIEEMEDELMKTERSFKNQIAVHEKKAHDNWLKARAAERAMVEERRESATLRHKLLEMTQKMSLLQKEPVIVKPLPGRPSAHNPPRRGPVSQNGCFGPSPVSGGECSPPLSSMAEPPARSLSATMLSFRDAPRSEFDAGSGASPMMNDSSRNSSPSRALDENKPTVPQESGSPSGPSSATFTEHPVGVTVAVKGPPLFPGMPPRGPPMAGPPPPPGRYGPPPPLARPFGPRPVPPPFGPGLRPPLGPREYAPGVPPGKLDGPYCPREFIPGPAPFRPLGPLGPREYFVPGTRLPHPPHGSQDYMPAPYGPQDYPPLPRGPQDYPPQSTARDFPPSGSRDEASYASEGGSPSSSQALR